MRNTHSSPTRERVLESIKRRGKATVKELTEEIGITPMAIRGHLNKLEKDSLIMVHSIRQKLGRPIQVFTLTDKGESYFPKDYGRFAVELLADIQAVDGGKTLKKVTKLREERIKSGITEILAKAKTPEEKVTSYCEFIEKHGHMPEIIKEDDEHFTLRVNNCALREIVAKFPCACHSEIGILRAVFPEAKIKQVDNILKKDQVCSFEFAF